LVTPVGGFRLAINGFHDLVALLRLLYRIAWCGLAVDGAVVACFVLPGSEDAPPIRKDRGSVGAKICASRGDAVEREAAVVFFVIGRACLAATESRWTNVFAVLK